MFILILILLSYFVVNHMDDLKRKSREELERMLLPESGEHFYPVALRELQQRGINIERYVDLFPGLIASQYRKRREDAWALLKVLYPYLVVNIEMDRKTLNSYEKSQQVAETLRKKIARRQAYLALQAEKEEE